LDILDHYQWGYHLAIPQQGGLYVRRIDGYLFSSLPFWILGLGKEEWGYWVEEVKEFAH